MRSRIPVYEPWLVPGDAEAVARVVRSGWVSSAGDALRAFEERWASYCGRRHGIAVSSGTAALELALEACGVGPGDEVICPTFTIISCARAIVRVGATAALVDSDPRIYAMDPEAVRNRITDRTAGILAVHMYGHPVNAEALLEITRNHGLVFVEDAAEAHGAEVRIGGEWVRCGGLGEVSIFSFYANKAITTGEGGMVMTDDDGIAERLRSLMNLGFKRERRFEHDELGHNFRMTNLQASLGVAQIDRLDSILERKRELARSYRERLGGVEGVAMQGQEPWARPVPWMIGIELDDDIPMDAAEFARRLSDHGVDSRPYFLGMHEQPVFIRQGLFDGESHPVAERLSRRGLYLPSSPTLDAATIDRVCGAVRQVLSGRGIESSLSAPAAEPPLEPPGDAAPFGEVYAAAYDDLYGDKDYAREVDALEICFRRFGQGAVEDVLDLGCGTGRHMALLLDRGYRVTGVDRSGAMLQAAQDRLGGRDGATLVEASIASFHAPGKKWDAVLMMFAVLSYQTDTAQVLEALRVARAHLTTGGLLVADIWYGPAVLAQPPGRRTKEVGESGNRWVRHVEGEHDPIAQLATVRYSLEHAGSRGVDASDREEHVLRYFFPREIELLLELSGFGIVHLGGWPAIDDPPRPDGYAAVVVGRAS